MVKTQLTSCLQIVIDTCGVLVRDWRRDNAVFCHSADAGATLMRHVGLVAHRAEAWALYELLS